MSDLGTEKERKKCLKQEKISNEIQDKEKLKTQIQSNDFL